MKKIITIFSFLVALTFMAGPSYALVGTPDAVPGTDVVLPFFLVEKTSAVHPFCGAGDNTLLTITEVGGVSGALNFTVYTKRTKDLVNDVITYTPYDVLPILVSDIINNMPTDLRDQLQITFKGKTYYCGYIVFENSQTAADNLIAHMYQVDLTGGLAAGVVIPAKEDASTLDPLLQDDSGRLLEAFNADAYSAAEQLIAKIDDPLVESTWFRLMPRYFLHDEATGESYIIIWASDNYKPGEIHIYIYDEEETPYSITITIDEEVELIDVAGIIPEEFKNYTDPDKSFAAGWIAIDLPDLDGFKFDGTIEHLGYSWQMAYDAAVGTNWSVLFDVHRDAGTAGTI